MARVTRTTHQHDGEITVFLIGFRINRLRAVRQWLSVFRAMPPMIRELEQDPDSGFLGVRTTVAGRGALLVQYWRSVEDIYRYANDEDARHRPAWKEFHRLASADPGAVGIWHETYRVPAGHHESIATGMPTAGLAAATTEVPVAGRLETARQRMGTG